MEKTDSEPPKTLYINGCKITVQYSREENPSAVQNIRNTLIGSGNPQKN